MNANFGLVDELPDPVRDKRLKREILAARALAEIGTWLDQTAAAHR
jgi:folate-dependent tRNA-U54 methylase TrmFO/GidA